MSTSSMQDRDFGTYFLDKIVNWVQNHLDVGDVFISQEIKDWCNRNYEPDDVYDEGTLIDWAEKNGWIKEQ